ncbi:MAG: flagellar hook-length control protein FliK [Pseudomonadota bacterium]
MHSTVDPASSAKLSSLATTTPVVLHPEQKPTVEPPVLATLDVRPPVQPRVSNRDVVARISTFSDVSMDTDARVVQPEIATANATSTRSNLSNPISSLVMPVGIDNVDWAGAFAQKVQQLLKAGARNAEIRMDPPHLGRVEVRIDVVADRTVINFAAEQGAVRDTIDNNLGRLREQLASAGFDNVSVDVSNKGSRENPQDRQTADADVAQQFASFKESDNERRSDEELGYTGVRNNPAESEGLVNIYA